MTCRLDVNLKGRIGDICSCTVRWRLCWVRHQQDNGQVWRPNCHSSPSAYVSKYVFLPLRNGNEQIGGLWANSLDRDRTLAHRFILTRRADHCTAKAFDVCLKVCNCFPWRHIAGNIEVKCEFSNIYQRLCIVRHITYIDDSKIAATVNSVIIGRRPDQPFGT